MERAAQRVSVHLRVSMCVRLFMGRQGQDRCEENTRVGAFVHSAVKKKGLKEKESNGISKKEMRGASTALIILQSSPLFHTLKRKHLSQCSYFTAYQSPCKLPCRSLLIDNTVHVQPCMLLGIHLFACRWCSKKSTSAVHVSPRGNLVYTKYRDYTAAKQLLPAHNLPQAPNSLSAKLYSVQSMYYSLRLQQLVYLLF